MLVRAKTSFSGAISMVAGDVRDIRDGYVLKDLLKAGYVEPEAQEAEIVEKPVEKIIAKSTPEEAKALDKAVEIYEKSSTKKKKSKK